MHSAALIPRALRLLVPAGLLLTALPAAAEHTYGGCAPTPVERCERWSATIDDPDVASGARSDQFSVATLTTPTTAIAVVKDVAFNPNDAYSSGAKSMIVAYDVATGAEKWRVRRSERTYLSPHAAGLSPDGRTLFVTGAAYNGFPVGATDSQVSTTAYDVGTGHELWTTDWQGRPDASDNGNYLAVSPDGSEVYVAAITTAAGGGLDYLTLAYSARDGRQLWQAIYSGVKPNADDAVFGIAVDSKTDMLYITGWSAGTADYDNDYATVAYALGHQAASHPNNGRGHAYGHDRGPVAGQQMWVARYDGIGADKSDRANAIAVDPTGARVFVSGDSYNSTGGYSYGTVAYDAATGKQLWEAAYNGGRGGFNSATLVTATASAILVSGQATAPSSSDGNDATTVAYDAATGRQLWASSVAPARSDDYSRAIRLSPDHKTAYLVTSDIPIVPYTGLTRLTLTALDVATGATRWQSTLDGGLLDALAGESVAVGSDGTVAALGDLTRSANPVGGTSQNVYDAVLAVFGG